MAAARSEDPRRGVAVYGLRLLGLGAAAGNAPEDWEAWRVRRTVRDGCELDGDSMTLWEERALIPIPGLGRIEIDRPGREIAFITARPLSEEAILHPGLVPAAAVVNAWKRRACIHGSAVAEGGRAWAFLSDRGGGKSTTAALLARRGHALLTDDMLIVDDLHCFAGPASVDLRGDASAALGGRFLGVIGHRERWRVALKGAALEAELAGVIELAWTDGPIEVTELGVPERLELIGRHASMPIPPDQLLALASVPAVRVARAHDLQGAGEALDVLEGLLAA